MKNLGFKTKALATLGMLAVTTSMLGGCGQLIVTEEESTPSGGKTATQKEDYENELTFAIAIHENDESLVATYNQIAQMYLEKTGTKVNLELIPDKDMRTWVTTQHAAGTPPHVYDSRLANIWEDYTKGYLISLDEYLDQASPYVDNGTWRESFSPSLINQTVDAQGVTAGVPISISGVRLIYNKDLLEKANIEQLPVTLEEFYETCEALLEVDVIPMGFPNSQSGDPGINWWGHNFVSQLDEDFRNQIDLSKDNVIQLNELAYATDQGLVDFTQYPFKDTFDIMMNLSQYWNSDASSTNLEAAFDMWLRGDVAIMTIGSHNSSLISSLDDISFEYEVGYFPTISKAMYPQSTQRPLNNGGRVVSAIGVTKTGNQEEEARAVDFLQYFLSAEPQTLLIENNFIIPPLKNMELSDDLKWWLTSENEDMLRANYFGPATSKQFAEYTQMSGQLLFAGNLSLEQYLEELNTEWHACMKKIKETNGWTAENNYGIK